MSFKSNYNTVKDNHGNGNILNSAQEFSATSLFLKVKEA